MSDKPQTTKRGPMEDMIIPIQTREGMFVHIQGIPYDFTAEEAERISRIIKSMVHHED